MGKKKSLGKIIGGGVERFIDTTTSSFGSFLKDTAAKPGQAINALHNENTARAQEAEIAHILKGLHSPNLRQRGRALDFLHNSGMSREAAEELIRRYR